MQLIDEVRVVLFLVTPRLKTQVLAGQRSPTRKWDITTTVRDFVWLA